ncbi:hypothetical protein KIPB_006154 [Kipferlia bialata]|uniref:Uncharacterized protein n=1 Tax=Kipferlia bialata TaxID=797122 RepID=A0A9K3CYF6_9EUKA|nr:hypothetical protein KIPB_006154 [Kipferlia bialata]|eukprot:g6154.t1
MALRFLLILLLIACTGFVLCAEHEMKDTERERESISEHTLHFSAEGEFTILHAEGGFTILHYVSYVITETRSFDMLWVRGDTVESVAPERQR